MSPKGASLRPSCGVAAASFNRLRALAPTAVRPSLDQLPPAPRVAAGAAGNPFAPVPLAVASSASPFALLMLPIAPAAARAAAKALPPQRAPIDVLSTGILIAIILVAIGRTLIRRYRMRRELQAPPELLRVPVSEMAMFDTLREAGDRRKLEEAWRDLVARKRAEREKRIASTLAAQQRPIESLSDLPFSLRDLDASAAAGRPVAPSADSRSWTPVKAAAARINGQRSYLAPPAGAEVQAGAGSGPSPLGYANGGYANGGYAQSPAGVQGSYAPNAPPTSAVYAGYASASLGSAAAAVAPLTPLAAPPERRFPPPRSAYARPSQAQPATDAPPAEGAEGGGTDGAADAGGEAPAAPRLGPGPLAQRFAASRAGQSTRAGGGEAGMQPGSGGGLSAAGPLSEAASRLPQAEQPPTTRALELRTANLRAARLSQPAGAAGGAQWGSAPAQSSQPAVAPPPPRTPAQPAQTVAGAAAAEARLAWGGAGEGTSAGWARAEGADGGEGGARTVAAALGRAAGALVKLPVVVVVAFVRALVEPLPAAPAQPERASAPAALSWYSAAQARAGGASPPLDGQPLPAPPPLSPRPATAPVAAPPVTAAEPFEPTATPASAAWQILSAKAAQIDRMVERGGGTPPPRA